MNQASIFIIEDEVIVAEDLRETLNALGYTVTGAATSGEAALPALETARPDLVLVDIQLAGTMDGIETARIIQDRFGYPVIFLTAHSDNSNIARAKLTGPYGYIIKPFSDRELHSTIEMALSRHRLDILTREKERTIRALANAIPDPVMLLDRRLTILAANDAMARDLGSAAPSEGRRPARLADTGGRFASLAARAKTIFTSPKTEKFEEKYGDTWYEVSLWPLAGQDEEPLLLVQYHDITGRKQIEEQIRTGGITQIEQNMEQFQILNDEIRNPLQAILGYVSLDCDRYQEDIVAQVGVINDLVRRLDRGWVESEKVRNFLLKHYLEEDTTSEARS